MALTGTWKEAHAIESGALKWGTGYNPVHAIPTEGPSIRNTATLTLTEGDQGETLPESLEDYGYMTEDASSILWGYGPETGTSDRPGIGVDETLERDNTDGHPPWGKYHAGMPGGTGVRSENHGADVTTTTKEKPAEDAAQGWENKESGNVLNARTSDPSQYEMQTSMQQRDRTREGSQRGEGSASSYKAPIRSRIVGMRVKTYVAPDSVRHEDMTPREQTSIIRPFWTRTAGTGYRSWMAPNEAYDSQPLNREPPNLPDVGPTVPVTDSYGYTSEDMIPYA